MQVVGEQGEVARETGQPDGAREAWSISLEEGAAEDPCKQLKRVGPDVPCPSEHNEGVSYGARYLKQ
jgi:hypothetical protein